MFPDIHCTLRPQETRNVPLPAQISKTTGFCRSHDWFHGVFAPGCGRWKELVDKNRSNNANRAKQTFRSASRKPLAVLRTLTLPLIRPGVLAGMGLVFLTSMKELPATLILRPIGFDTLATQIWTAASEGIYSEAALPTLLLLLASVGPVHLLFIRPMLAERP